MSWFRLLRVCLHLLAGLMTAALVFPLVDRRGRARLVGRWSSRLLRICRISVDVHGDAAALAQERALIVANHVSWLDIFVINTMLPCRFVAKSDIRGWPLVGWLCDRAGTIFISRGSVRDVRRIFQNLVDALRQGEHVAFFPEGTTVAQGSSSTFHANLFEAAIDARVPVQPFALRYLDAHGDLHPAADFVGEMTFLQSMLTILRSEAMRAELTVLPVMSSEGAPRRQLAREAQAVIASALGIDSGDAGAGEDMRAVGPVTNA